MFFTKYFIFSLEIRNSVVDNTFYDFWETWQCWGRPLINKYSSPLLKTGVTPAIFMFSEKIFWLTERFSACFKTPNFFPDTLYHMMKHHYSLDSDYFLVKKKHFYFFIAKFFSFKIWAFTLNILLKINIWYWSFWSWLLPNTYKKLLDFFAIVFWSVISFSSITILHRSFSLLNLDFPFISFIISPNSF